MVYGNKFKVSCNISKKTLIFNVNIFSIFIRRINLHFVVINPKKNKSKIPSIALGQFLGELNRMDNYCKNRQQYNKSMTFFYKNCGEIF
jgi:hypothetical protein